ncbi:MAG TPA: hypothetical protein DCR04_06860 [Flavobacteriales bacterium]|nr:hypothetical protein [Flavobacteriales bacterium]
MLLRWDSNIGTYQHRCDSCGREFYGRKNRLYCNDKCKHRLNNELASKKRVKERSLTEDYLRNIGIIEKIVGEENYDVEITTMEYIKARGFEPECVNMRVYVHGERWFKIGPFGYRPLEKSNEVELIRFMKDDTIDNS